MTMINHADKIHTGNRIRLYTSDGMSMPHPYTHEVNVNVVNPLYTQKIAVLRLVQEQVDDYGH